MSLEPDEGLFIFAHEAICRIGILGHCIMTELRKKSMRRLRAAKIGPHAADCQVAEWTILISWCIIAADEVRESRSHYLREKGVPGGSLEAD